MQTKLPCAEYAHNQQITLTSIEKLTPYERNAHTHSAKQIQQISNSIKQFGLINPVLMDANGRIMASHGRVEAAKKLGLREVPTLRFDHLSDDQIRAYIDAGNPMTPKHSRTRKRHYRYYTSQAIIQSRHHKAGSLPNIPAGEIERLVKNEIRDFLQDSKKLQAFMANRLLDEQARLLTFANTLTWNNIEAERIFLRSIISKIVISDSQVEIDLCPNSLLKSLKASATDKPIQHQAETDIGNPVRLIRKAKLAATNNDSKVIAGQIASGCNMQLVKGITRSFLWHEQIINGEAESIKAISQRENIDSNSYVSEVLRLRFLAPDIIECILNGTNPIHWTYKKLIRVKATNWADQRQQLGLA